MFRALLPRLLAFLPVLLPLSATAREPPAGEKIRIAAVGDSITFGSQVQDREVNSYPAVLNRLLGEQYEVRNFGISGGTLLKAGDKPYWKQPVFAEAKAFEPHIVIIKLGTNDAKAHNWVHKDQFSADLGALIEEFAALPSKPKVFVALPAPAIHDRMTISQRALDEQMPMTREVARAKGVPVIDLYAALKPHPEHFPDGIHPNAAGAAVIAATVAQVIQQTAPSAPAQETSYDLVVYGGTSAGVIAAVQAKKMGKTAVIVGPDKHLGGLSSGGLGFTDTGNKAVIGGLSRDFYHRLYLHYQQPEAWKWQAREQYGNKGQGTPAIDGANRTMWIFEPHAAEKVFEDYVREFEIPVHRDEWLDREKGVKKEGARISAITMLSGKTYTGKMFIDATYEGDLMAAAGIDYHVGREALDVYGEKWNGVQTGVLHHRHHFGVLKTPISPYVVPGDPQSGILPRINPEHPGEYGAGDKKVQAYCYRMCLTDHPENRIPFSKPEGYDPKQYELLVRIYEAGWNETFHKFDPIPNRKTDTNNHGPFSLDNMGYNYDYPEATYERRREILKEHQTYQMGWFYFIANDPRIPKETQEKMQQWGLPKDEFQDNGGWPHQIYVREARRMIGSFVMTENELLQKKPTPDSVGMGSYTIDSHNVQRYITPEGHVQNEGDIGVSTPVYQIAYGSLVPKKEQCENLLVPVCVSSSHIAFGSIRMEPVFMILGQSAATAAVIAIEDQSAVQEVPYEKLQERLLADGQVLEHGKKP